MCTAHPTIPTVFLRVLINLVQKLFLLTHYLSNQVKALPYLVLFDVYLTALCGNRIKILLYLEWNFLCQLGYNFLQA